MYMEALFGTEKNWKQGNCLIDKWLNKPQYIYIMEWNSEVKKYNIRNNLDGS